MLDVDEGSEAAALLCLCDDSKSKGRFAGRFRAVNLDHSSPRKTANPKRAINQNIAGRNNVDVDNLLVAQPHDGAVSVVLGDLLNGQIQIFIARCYYLAFGRFFFGLGRHECLSS